MQPREIESVIVAVLRDIQTTSGRQWTELNQESRPLGDLDGFDSLSGVEVTVAIEQKLGCKFDTDSIFTSEDGKHALNLKQIGERICKMLGSKGSSK
ncbi:MAG: acyl carrier protein [Armatimonadota bacterium]|nr:acyl carrier protein [Armatimonadota bacterium]